MLYLLGSLTVLACIAGHYIIPSLVGKIVGGEDVTIVEFPYQVSLLHYGDHICGGSIISPDFVVTAAHCTNGLLADELSIRTGSSIRDYGGSVVNVAKIYQNPSFDGEIFDYDISVLALASPLGFGSGIDSIGLPLQDQVIPVGTNSIITGWGKLTEDGVLATELQAVQVEIMNLEECRIAYGESKITDRMICAGVTDGGKDSCKGDSGGPLVVNGQLVGIISAGVGCASPIYPGLYASVPALRSYITSVSNI